MINTILLIKKPEKYTICKYCFSQVTGLFGGAGENRTPVQNSQSFDFLHA